MASTPTVLLAALGAILYFSLIGLALARWAGLAWAPAGGVAPALGWGVLTAVAFGLQTLIGFSLLSTAAIALLALAGSAAVLARRRGATTTSLSRLPAWSYGWAGLIALIPLAGILPKTGGGGVLLSPVMFDHAKVAMIDEMTRAGLPAGNPFFAASGARSSLTYYYLWHFGAAQLSKLSGVSGWEADAAMTGFTAYASLTLMMALAVRLCSAWPQGRFAGQAATGGRRGPAIAVLCVGLISLTGTLRPVVSWLVGAQRWGRWIANYSGLAGWMVQSSWTPQHVAAASCVVVAVLALADLSQRPRLVAVLVLGALAAAGFGSSAYVGGVTFAVAALGVGLVGLAYAGSGRRVRFLAGAIAAAALAVVLALPLLQAELKTLAAPSGGKAIDWHPYEVVGAILPPGPRRVLDFPAYWLGLLPLELPASYPVGIAALVGVVVLGVRRRSLDPHVLSLGVLALASFGVTWLLASTIVYNDLGWRALLPGVFLLTAFTAAAVARGISIGTYGGAACAALLFALSVPDRQVFADLRGQPSAEGVRFANAVDLWAAVRRHAGPTDRVADNPLFLMTMTKLPGNPSWALLSNRPSCYSGWETVRAYVDLPRTRIESLDDQFVRVFGGEDEDDDVRQLAQDYGCRVVAVTASDGAWNNDPFSDSPYYRLVEQRKDLWRVYVATSPPRPAPGHSPPDQSVPGHPASARAGR